MDFTQMMKLIFLPTHLLYMIFIMFMKVGNIYQFFHYGMSVQLYSEIVSL